MSYYVNILCSPTLIVCHPRGGLPCPDQGIKVLSSLPIISGLAKSLASRHSGSLTSSHTASSAIHFLGPPLLLLTTWSKMRTQNPHPRTCGGNTMSGFGNIGPFEHVEHIDVPPLDWPKNLADIDLLTPAEHAAWLAGAPFPTITRLPEGEPPPLVDN